MTALVFACASFVVGCSWGEGSGSDDPPGPDASGAGGGGVCGDGVCAANEVTSCATDCGTGGGGGGGGGNAICGNNTCETGESPTSCPNDCTSGGGGGSGSGTPTGCGTPPPADFSACVACIIPGSGTCPGGDINGCLACIPGGGLPGGPGANCNNDGICDTGEDASCILDMCP